MRHSLVARAQTMDAHELKVSHSNADHVITMYGCVSAAPDGYEPMFFGWARAVAFHITNVPVSHSDEVPEASVTGILSVYTRVYYQFTGVLSTYIVH